MNKGEYNELAVKLKLIEIRDNKKSIIIDGNTLKIDSVGFNGIEYPLFPLGTDLKRLSRSQTIELAQKMSVNKASIYDKGDVQINGKYYSIKSLEDAPPALVNHTNRHGWLRVCKECNIDIKVLDLIIDEYWKLRTNGVIREDVHNDSANSPFYIHKEYLKPLLKYFLFKGSGSRSSAKPADFILDFHDPLEIKTWKIYDEEVLDLIWHKLIFSVRSKKGMNKYPKISDPLIKECISVWTKYFQGEYRGALHIRLKK